MNCLQQAMLFAVAMAAREVAVKVAGAAISGMLKVLRCAIFQHPFWQNDPNDLKLQ